MDLSSKVTSELSLDEQQASESSTASLAESQSILGGTNGDVRQSLLPPMGFGKHKPKMLLMGLKRSGKSSISNVVFHKMAPHETLFLEATTAIQKQNVMKFMDFQIWDLPGQIDYLSSSLDSNSVFSDVGGIVWVIDAQDNYLEPISRFTSAVVALTELYPSIRYSVFIHKTDSITEDYREDTIRDVMQKISDELFDEGLENPPVSYFPTSIYDHTIFEAFSKVIQGLVPQLPTYETLLDTVAASCRFQKVYIFEVTSKVYIASDTKPSDLSSYELCSDFINAIMDMYGLYSWDRPKTSSISPMDDERHQDVGAQTVEAMVCSARGNTVYLRELNAFLVFIGVSKEPNFQKEKAMVDYNIQMFQNTLLRVLDRG
ncbi:GTP-binding protein gtr2 [Xanthoria parietina]